MKIENGWDFDDPVSGLMFRVVVGKKLDILKVGNRDLWFTKDGKFDGTGSSVCEAPKEAASPCGAVTARS